MTQISTKPSNYWDNTYASVGLGVTLLVIAGGFGALAAAFSTGEFLILQASFSGMFGLAGILFLVDAVVAKGHRFQEIRSAAKRALRIGSNFTDEVHENNQL